MANVNYSEGVTEVAPKEESPGDYQSPRGADIEAFGGGTAQALEKLGQGALTSSKFFGKVAADNASNDYQDFATKLLHGDPNKTGPDGMPDTGYLGLKGRAALDARPDVQKQLDDKAKEIGTTLQTPEQQQDFENFSRRYRTGAVEKIGSHADTQASTWYQGVNTASAKLALDHISINADNPKEYLAGEADLVHSYVKNAQLNGAQPGDPQYDEAVAAGRRDALKARLDAVAVKNPLQAQSILDKPENKAIAGQYYDNMSSAYRGRAKQQQGFGVGEETLKSTYAANPAVNLPALTAAGARYGVSTSYMVNTQRMETGTNPNQISPTGAKGPFQFIGSTAQQYGLKNPFDYEQSADAAAHLAADNQVKLTTSLGRPASDPELYIAHNQGAAGAAKLLANPNARAGDLVGDQAIRVNGGDPNAPAIAFTSMMTNKFNGSAVAATQNRKAQATQAILAIPDDQIDPDVRQHALAYVNQQISAQAIAEEQDAKSKKAATDKVQSDIASDIIKGVGSGPDMISRIANSGLPANEIENLYKFATGEGGIEDPLRYGPSYTGALKRILADPNDPSHISSPAEIIQMGAQGQLSKKGVSELLGTMTKIQKQPDQAGISTVKSHQLDFYKSQMAIDSGMPNMPGVPAFKNAKGLDIFNHSFVPAFESAYQQWVAAGKDPMEFLNDTKKMDAIMDRVYPPSQRKSDSLFANNETGPNAQKGVAPVAPEGADSRIWSKMMNDTPKGWESEKWAGAITSLHDNPSPEMIASFNYWFGATGYTAQEALKVYGKAPHPPAPPERKDRPDEPGILSKAVDNILHYGKTGQAPSEGYHGDSPVPLAEEESLADRMTRENAVKPGERASHEPTEILGIRG